MISAPAQARTLCRAVVGLEVIEAALRAHYPGPLPEELHAQAVHALAAIRQGLAEIVRSMPHEVRFPAPHETEGTS
jgi:hypothetical protein